MPLNKMLRTAFIASDCQLDLGLAWSVSTIYGHTNCLVITVLFESLNQCLRPDQIFKCFFTMIKGPLTVSNPSPKWTMDKNPYF